MRFHTVLLLLTFLGLVSVTLNDYTFSVQKLESKAIDSRQVFVAKRFIAESFRNTCNGKGFKDLEEWQLSCRALFKLEYIGWCQAQDFMIDEIPGKGELMYGKWIGSENLKECSDEVYCRKKQE